MKLLDIAEVSARTGPPGLDAVVLRRHRPGILGRSSRFAASVPAGRAVADSLISMGKSAGFSLGEIAQMFSPTGEPDLPRHELHARADALDRQIRELTALRDTLRHVADCPAPTHMQCPTFRRLVDLAGRRGGAALKPPQPRPKRPA
ncbi:MAG: MerR family DNA-binding protein [Paracoccaceae bacterium]